MVWNIEFQCAGLIMALVVAAMCLRQKRLRFSAERAYTRLLSLVILSIISDIVSIFAINYIDVIGQTTTTLICKFYLLTIVMVACQAAFFAAAEVRYSFNTYLVYATYIPAILEVIVLCIFPIYLHNADGEIYSYGVPVIVTYVFCALYIAASTTMVVRLRKKITDKRRSAIYFWMASWVIVATIQFINNSLLLVSFIMALAVLYMYCKLENPEYHLDYATGVFNKKGFKLIMHENIRRHKKCAIVTIGITDTKVINEVFGNQTVEKIILHISEFADGIPNSTLFRIEETLFCMLFEDKEEAEKAIDLLQRRFSEPWEADDISCDVNATFSYIEDISSFNDEETLEEVIYYFAEESKKITTGEVLVVDNDELKRRAKNIEMQYTLDWALKNDSILVYYQPIYDIKAGKFSSLEALVRLKDQDGTIIGPDEFIEYSEKNGMILRLGETVFRKVCLFIQRSHIEKYGIEFIEVNLSTVQCMQVELSRMLKNIMGEYQVPPYRINFEITESAAMTSKRALDLNMKKLMEYGSSFSLDDYGSGYSNLSYVVSLPLRILKIDKLLTSGYFENEKVRIATVAAIEMAHKLEMKVVVEGVETEEQFLEFKKLDVEYIQGFYFSRPLPQDEVIEFIQRWL